MEFEREDVRRSCPQAINVTGSIGCRNWHMKSCWAGLRGEKSGLLLGDNKFDDQMSSERAYRWVCPMLPAVGLDAMNGAGTDDHEVVRGKLLVSEVRLVVERHLVRAGRRGMAEVVLLCKELIRS